MAKYPAFQFYTGDWLKDPDLSKCLPATRGIWMDAICAMHESDRSGILSGTPDQLSRVLRCLPSDVHTAMCDLRTNKAATVRECNGVWTLINRRMHREYLQRVATRERVRKHRHVTHVQQGGNDPSSSSSSTSVHPPNPPVNGGAYGNGARRRKRETREERSDRKRRETIGRLSKIP